MTGELACIPLDTVLYILSGAASAVALAARAAWSWHQKVISRMAEAIDKLGERHLAIVSEVVERANHENSQWREHLLHGPTN